METIDRNEFTRLLDSVSLVIGTPTKPWLARTPDGKALKFLYRRKRFSSAMIRSPAARFAANGEKLAQREILAPRASRILFCPDLPAHLVEYPWLAGEDLRAICRRGDGAPLTEFADYLARLHREGVYFRAIHLGNVLRGPDGRFALVDITDLTCKRRALSPFERARNVAHLFANREDAETFSRYGTARFLGEYLEASGLSPGAAWWFRWRLRRALPTQALPD